MERLERRPFRRPGGEVARRADPGRGLGPPLIDPADPDYTVIQGEVQALLAPPAEEAPAG